MAELFDAIAEAIQQLVSFLGYPGIALASLLEAVFPPLPSELVMPFGGFQVARGDLTFAGVVIAGTLGSLAGAIVVYHFGRWADEALIRRFLRRYGRYFGVSEHDLDRALAIFSRYGEAVVFFGRLIPLIRTLISIPAGMERMPLPRFALFTALGTAIWSALLAGAGYLLGDNWEQLLVWMESYQTFMLVVSAVIGVALVVFLLVRFLRHSNAGNNRRYDRPE
ncbi:MAG: DedA family protein [Chloroflexota bacterium]|nr:MAG: DedA family protein [Chloroflexota bacterium]